MKLKNERLERKIGQIQSNTLESTRDQNGHKERNQRPKVAAESLCSCGGSQEILKQNSYLKREIHNLKELVNNIKEERERAKTKWKLELDRVR